MQKEGSLPNQSGVAEARQPSMFKTTNITGNFLGETYVNRGLQDLVANHDRQ